MKFTKTYSVEMNEKQRAAITRAFKSLASYFLNEEKKDVEVTVDKFGDKKIIAQMIVDGAVFQARLIGANGGLTVV
jgi:hypothetical protein